jgi:hypothetical protein
MRADAILFADHGSASSSLTKIPDASSTTYRHTRLELRVEGMMPRARTGSDPESPPKFQA